jgi:protein SCO1/2
MLAWTVCTASGCGREGTPRGVPGAGSRAGPASQGASLPGTAQAAPGRESVRYKLTGVVRKLDPEHHTVTLRHDVIPGFMPAMTMPFAIKDKAAFDDLRVDDEVEGTLRVDREGGEVADYELLDLVVTRPAQAPGLSLSVGPDGVARLTPAPRELQPGDLVPDFTMTTQAGATLRLSDLRGQVVVLTFIYTRCPLPDFCPASDRKFAELADRLGAVPARAKRVRLLSVSFDPEHDTPEILRKHAAMRGARAPLWTFAVASHPELARVAAPLGLSYGPTAGEFVHNLSASVIDPEGRLVRLEAGAGGKTWQPADFLKTIYGCLAK